MDNSKQEGHSEALLKALSETHDTNRDPFFWPHIEDSETAKTAIQLGVIGSCIVMLFSIAGAIVDSPTILAEIFAVQAAIFGAIGFGIQKKSRIAAWIGLCLFPFSKVPFHFSLVMFFILLIPFLNGVRGTLAYRRYPADPLSSDLIYSARQISTRRLKQNILLYTVLMILFFLFVFHMKRKQIQLQNDRPHTEASRQQMDAAFEKTIIEWITAGVNLNSTQNFQHEQGYPLIFTGTNCLDHSFDLLISHGVDVHSTVQGRTMNTLGLLAIAPVCPEVSLEKMMGTLTQRGLDINAPVEGSISPLMFAVTLNLIPNARVLLQLKADVNRPAQDKNHLTPLLMASLRGWSEMARLLIEHGADINAKTAGGVTALQICEALKKVNGGHNQPGQDFDAIIKLLREHGAR
jgi:hypothetical protein